MPSVNFYRTVFFRKPIKEISLHRAPAFADKQNVHYIPDCFCSGEMDSNDTTFLKASDVPPLTSWTYEVTSTRIVAATSNEKTTGK